MDNVVIREVKTMLEFNALLELQQAIWGMTPGEATSPYMMNAVVHNSGVVIGAELEGRLVGFCFAFVAWRGEGKILWSHMAGVAPEFRGQDIGFRLKQAQRQWALDRGFSVISWTFDPMQGGNANFNFHRLKAIAETYLINHYGEMTDAINAGLASDRLEVRWQLSDERVTAASENRPLAGPALHIDEAAFVLRAGDNAALILSTEAAFQFPACFIEIPYEINVLKRNDIAHAQRWQQALRQAMQKAFQRGYIIVDFMKQDDRGWYVLMPKHVPMRELP